MRANGQYNDYLDGQLREPFKQFCRFHPQGQKIVFLHQMGLKMDQKELIVDLKRASSIVFGPSIPDFWLKKKVGDFFAK